MSVCCLCSVGPNSKSARRAGLLVDRACTAGTCVTFLLIVMAGCLMLIVMGCVDVNVDDDVDSVVDGDGDGW